MNNCAQLKAVFIQTMWYINTNFSKNDKLFCSENFDKFFTWWQRKMVHSRVGQLIQSHYSLVADNKGELVKGGTTIRDDLYQVGKRSKKI